MSTLTKEWLLKTIAELEEERDAVPGAVNEDAANALAAMKLALASREAKPLGYIDAEYAELLKSGHIESCSVYAESGEGCCPVYTATPALVSLTEVQRAILRDMDVEIGAELEEEEEIYRDGIRKCFAALRYHHKRAEAHSTGYKGSTLEEDTLKSINFLKRNNISAMLQGAENAETPTTMQTAPALDSSQIIAESPSGINQGKSEPVTTACKLRDAVEIIRNSGIEIDAEKIFAERDALNTPDCWCRTCRPVTVTDMRFVVCPDCGNKRCPHANDHRNACTGSNEPGQEGSAYPAAPQQEVK